MGKMDEVRAAMYEAMKNKEKERKDTLSLLLGALKNKYIDKREDLTETEENEVIKKEIRQTKETLELTPPDRTDIIEQCKFRISVLSEFAPEEMSEESIRAELTKVLEELEITDPTAKDKGKIMKALMPRVKGKADGALVNKVVAELAK